jgi:hypothetical protein
LLVGPHVGIVEIDFRLLGIWVLRLRRT